MGTYTDLFKRKSNPLPPDREDFTSDNATATQETPKIERNSERTEKRSDFSSELPIRRRTKRYSFEFYDDQIMKLKQLKRQAEDQGENVALSDMAREALDAYLKGKV